MKGSRAARAAAAVALSASAAISCHTAHNTPAPSEAPLQWPVERPRVRLAKTIATRADIEHQSLFSRLSKRDDDDLFVRPYAACWRGSTLVVTDPDAKRVVALEADERILSSRAGLFESPMAVAACPKGIVVVDSVLGGLALLDDNLRLEEWLVTDLQRPSGVACVGGWVVVAETGAHRIVAIGPEDDRRNIGSRGDMPGQFNFPTALSTSEPGAVWVGDTLNFRVQKIDIPSGDTRFVFGELGDAPGQMPRLKGVAEDAHGHLWVTDAHLDRVSIYNQEGELLLAFGSTGALPGQFQFPAGVAAHADGRVAVVDSLNRRVAVFEVLESIDAPTLR